VVEEMKAKGISKPVVASLAGDVQVEEAAEDLFAHGIPAYPDSTEIAMAARGSRVVHVVAGAARPARGVAVGPWAPTKPVEFVVPAGTGGGADQMARPIQGGVGKNNLMKQQLVAGQKTRGAGDA